MELIKLTQEIWSEAISHYFPTKSVIQDVKLTGGGCSRQSLLEFC